MNEELEFNENCRCACDEELLEEIARFSGQTVTIFTESGGASGCGFTGVVTFVGPCFVKLITCLGPAPCCSLGNSCVTPCCPTFRNDGCRRAERIVSVGAVVTIPVNKIVAFVHSAI